MEHVPSGVFGAIRRGGEGQGFVDTVVMLAIIGILFFGGIWVMIKLGDLIRWIRAKLR